LALLWAFIYVNAPEIARPPLSPNVFISEINMELQ
jgi:hypothetical protein